LTDTGERTLAAADLFAVTVALPGRPNRAAVAAALAGVAPVPLRDVDWGWRALGDGQVRVVMAHRDQVDAALRDGARRVTGDGVVLRAARTPFSPWWLLSAIPLLTGIGAWGLAARTGPPAQGADARQAIAAFRRLAASELLALLDAGLPRDATLHHAERLADGALLLEVDSVDPEATRAALGRDPMLATFRIVGQDAVPDHGVRLRLRSDRL
jgi:hypothetical protein